MEESKNIQSMFNRFHVILNELHYLDKYCDNYNGIDKILKNLLV